MKRILLLSLFACSFATGNPPAADAPKPLKVLLITGGCCHDYPSQQDILKKGLEARANVMVENMHTHDKSTKPQFPIYTVPDWAKGYDVIVHDECGGEISDPAIIKNILQAHEAGVPGVNLHCAMHSFRSPGQTLWFDYLGLQSSSHGPQLPIELSFTDAAHPILKGLTPWTTVNEELYNNIKVYESAHPLVRGKQGAGDKEGENNSVVVWTHSYGPKKTPVFSTTIGHNNVTVSDSRYLDMITRGLLWAAGKLNEDGTPAKGYGPGGK